MPAHTGSSKAARNSETCITAANLDSCLAAATLGADGSRVAEGQCTTMALRPDGLVFHVTPAAHLASILERGLEPRVGPRSSALGEPAPAVYFFTSSEAAEDGLTNWLSDQFAESEQLALLAVRAACMPDLRVTRGAEFEASSRSWVSPGCLAVLTADLGSVASYAALCRDRSSLECACTGAA